MRSVEEAKREARAVARLARPLLLAGERGTGKTTMARQVHDWSGRNGAFVSVNMAALPQSLFESELFGHTKGAFTGAAADRKGRFELAHGGTLFLDEIGELPAELQVKLLAVAESGELWPVGASKPTSVNTRIIAATNRDLSSLRPDLLDRFVFTLRMPTLLERGDALELAGQFIADASTELGWPVKLSASAKAWVKAYSWPGNVRQLRNVLLVAAALADGGVVEAAHLETAAGAHQSQASPMETAAASLPEWFSRAELERACGLGRSATLEWLAGHAEHNGLQSTARRYRLVPHLVPHCQRREASSSVD
jgi:DNA-binding NtrC family response regulator